MRMGGKVNNYAQNLSPSRKGFESRLFLTGKGVQVCLVAAGARLEWNITQENIL
ncbi:hypothetical protein NIES267_42630 [Calothrix parasitica NIES-267]|uniref:Uncharacterized protein n=1 Tax=Calothrix parasitica NIES-267 TaxID=1973488 RepID=A0A1Z4LU37_9CYAN|nr:hypothetical protein NIES267_42630 [Calothrix parasitica NIES-267]